MAEKPYLAFISYSHADRGWADWLFRRIESFRVPRHLVGESRGGRPVPERLGPLFKDREELASSSSLGESVADALRRSDALIVICSPSARESHWVNEEIRQFKALQGDARIFTLIVDGDEQSSFPPALLQTFDSTGQLLEEAAEPLAADTRRDGRSNALLKVIAGLLDISFDELKRRQLQRRYQRLTWLSSASLVLVVVLISAVVRATLAEREAAFRQSQAESLVEFMISDLRSRLQPIGRLDVLDEVGQKAMDYFRTVDENDETADNKSRRATVIRQLGEIDLEQGDVESALGLFERALKIQRRAFAMAPDDDRRFQLSQANFWLGYGYWEQGDYAQALPYLLEYARHSDALALADPERLDWQLEAVFAQINLGTIHYEQQEHAEALPEFNAASKRLEALISQHPDDESLPATLLQTLGWIGGSFWEIGDWISAREAFKKAAALARQLSDADPDNYYRREEYVLALQREGLAFAKTGQLLPGQAQLQAALEMAEQLVERENQNFYWQYALARGHWYLGEVNEMQAQAANALRHYELAATGFSGIDEEHRRPKFAIEHALLLNDAALLSYRLGDAAMAEKHLLRGLKLLTSQSGSREVEFALAETHLALACMSASSGGESLQEAASLVRRYRADRRPDHMALVEAIAIATGADKDAGLEDRKIDEFEFEKYSDCIDGV